MIETTQNNPLPTLIKRQANSAGLPLTTNFYISSSNSQNRDNAENNECSNLDYIAMLERKVQEQAKRLNELENKSKVKSESTCKTKEETPGEKLKVMKGSSDSKCGGNKTARTVGYENECNVVSDFHEEDINNDLSNNAELLRKALESELINRNIISEYITLDNVLDFVKVKNESDEHKQQLFLAQSLLNNYRIEIEKLHEENKELKSDANSAEMIKKINALNEVNFNYKVQLTSLTEKLKMYKDNFETINSDFETLFKEKNTYNKENNLLKERILTLTEQINNLELIITNGGSKDNNDKDGNIEIKENEYKKLYENLLIENRELRFSQSKYLKAISNPNTAPTPSSEPVNCRTEQKLRLKIQSLKKQLENYIAENESLKLNLQQNENTLKNNESAKSNNNVSEADIREKAGFRGGKMEDGNSQLKRDLEELREKYRGKEKEVEDLINENSHLKLEIKQNKLSEENFKILLNASENKAAESQQYNNMINQQIKELENEVENKDKIILSLNEEKCCFENEVKEKLVAFDEYVMKNKDNISCVLENVLKLCMYLDKYYVNRPEKLSSKLVLNSNNNNIDVQRIMTKINVISNIKDFNIQLNDDLFFETINDFVYYIYNDISRIFKRSKEIYNDKMLKEVQVASIDFMNEEKETQKEQIERINGKFRLLDSENKALVCENNRLKEDVLKANNSNKKLKGKLIEIEEKLKENVINLSISNKRLNYLTNNKNNLLKLTQKFIMDNQYKELSKSMLVIIKIQEQISENELNKNLMEAKLEVIKSNIEHSTNRENDIKKALKDEYGNIEKLILDYEEKLKEKRERLSQAVKEYALLKEKHNETSQKEKEQNLSQSDVSFLTYNKLTPQNSLSRLKMIKTHSEILLNNKQKDAFYKNIINRNANKLGDFQTKSEVTSIKSYKNKSRVTEISKQSELLNRTESIFNKSKSRKPVLDKDFIMLEAKEELNNVVGEKMSAKELLE